MKHNIFRFYAFAILIIPLFMACSSNDNNNDVLVPAAIGVWVDERDGSEYGWVRYGDMEWTTRNLRFKPETGIVFPDTTPIPDGYYDDGVASKYYKDFGYLYDFKAAEAAIPEGWRLPTNEDWNKLSLEVNGNITKALNLSYSGYYLVDTYFQQIHKVDYYTYVYGFYWTSTTDDSKTDRNFAFYRKIVYNDNTIVNESMNKNNYLSVRLVRDVK